MRKKAVEQGPESAMEGCPAAEAPDYGVPGYLEENYWWAYLHPRSLRFFEKQWVINAILWGNYARLRDATLDRMGEEIGGRTLQVACVYGNLTPSLAERHRPDARLDVVDVAAIQLDNLSHKLDAPNVFLHCQDAARLKFDDADFDRVLLFFLLHELPLAVRKKAVREAMRVLKPGGKLLVVDYHRPVRKHPLRYLMPLVFKTLEPFALDLWEHDIVEWVPKEMAPSAVTKTTCFGGLYQLVELRR